MKTVILLLALVAASAAAAAASVFHPSFTTIPFALNDDDAVWPFSIFDWTAEEALHAHEHPLALVDRLDVWSAALNCTLAGEAQLATIPMRRNTTRTPDEMRCIVDALTTPALRWARDAADATVRAADLFAVGKVPCDVWPNSCNMYLTMLTSVAINAAAANKLGTSLRETADELAREMQRDHDAVLSGANKATTTTTTTMWCKGGDGLYGAYERWIIAARAMQHTSTQLAQMVANGRYAAGMASDHGGGNRAMWKGLTEYDDDDDGNSVCSALVGRQDDMFIVAAAARNWLWNRCSTINLVS